MRLTTALPITTLSFGHWRQNGTEETVVLAKAVFQRVADGMFRIAEPEPLEMTDVFEGDPATTPLLREQELAPGKVATDLILKAVARAPGSEALAQWPVRLSIADRLFYEFHVRGPTLWRQVGQGWRQSRPQPVREVPLSYALAYGGVCPAEDATSPETYESNPSGLGFVTEAALGECESLAAPQIGNIGDFFRTDPLQPMALHGTGPIARAWLPRRAFAGTFDDIWRKTRQPQMPEDFDLRFWNVAHRPLQLSPKLIGTERIRVEGIRYDGQPVTVQLPHAALMVRMLDQSRFAAPMELDTVELDLTSEDPPGHRLTLIWSCILPLDASAAGAQVEPIRI